jgi:hypothetical protein
MIHFGLLHMFRKITDIRKLIERLTAESKANANNPAVHANAEAELKNLKNFKMAYEL